MLSNSEYRPGVHACDEMPRCDKTLTLPPCSLVMLQKSNDSTGKRGRRTVERSNLAEPGVRSTGRIVLNVRRSSAIELS